MNDTHFQPIPLSMADRFGPAFPADIPGFADTEDSPFLVPANPGYVFDNIDALRILRQVWVRELDRPEHQHRKGLYVSGPTGSGKTSFIEQFFARIDVPMIRVTWNPKREAEELVSSQTMIDGDLFPQDQAIAIAARLGIPVLINEVDLADPAELMGLADVVEKGLITLTNGTSFIAKRGFLVFATGNTSGTDDDSGIYHGTRSQNAAFLRRFFHIHMGYMSEQQELEFLESQFPGVSFDLLSAASKVVTRLRSAFEGTAGNERLSSPISRPEVTDWVDMMQRFSNLKDKGTNVAEFSLDLCYASRLSESDRTAVHQILQACWT